MILCPEQFLKRRNSPTKYPYSILQLKQVYCILLISLQMAGQCVAQQSQESKAQQLPLLIEPPKNKQLSGAFRCFSLFLPFLNPINGSSETLIEVPQEFPNVGSPIPHHHRGTHFPPPSRGWPSKPETKHSSSNQREDDHHIMQSRRIRNEPSPAKITSGHWEIRRFKMSPKGWSRWTDDMTP